MRLRCCLTILPHRWANVGPCLWWGQTWVSPSDYIFVYTSCCMLLWSESSSNLVQHAFIMFSGYIVSQYLLLKFLLTCWTIQHSAWQLWLLQSPHCQSQRQLIAYTYCLVRGLARLFELRTKKWMSPCSTAVSGHSGLIYAAARACFLVHSVQT